MEVLVVLLSLLQRGAPVTVDLGYGVVVTLYSQSLRQAPDHSDVELFHWHVRTIYSEAILIRQASQ